MVSVDELLADEKGIFDGALVCFRSTKYLDGFVLISRWNEELRTAYLFAHSEPYTSQKGNREPFFPEAVFEPVAVSEQTPERLMSIYAENDKQPDFRSKILFQHLLYVLED